MHTRTALVASSLLLAPALALAHPGDHPASFLAGLGHPLTGLDHLLAMIAVGLLAGRFTGRARWLVPLCFVAMMLCGALMDAAGIVLPATETMIVMSVLALGFAIAAPRTLGLAAAIALVGFFALFHGFAHAQEARGASFVAYVAGFSVATTLLHAVGVAFMLALSGSHVQRATLLRISGRVVMIGGVTLALRMV